MNRIIRKVRRLQREIQDALVSRDGHWGLRERAESFVGLFENQIPPASEVLDVGGAWGFYKGPLIRRGHRVTILDVVRPRLQKAPVVLYDGRRMPFSDKRFDAALLIGVLHHMRDPEAVVREVRRVTCGVVVVVEDLYHHALGRGWTELRDRLYNMEFVGHPCQFRKRDEWVAFFEQAGFQLLAEEELYTWIAGLRILNGLFVFQTH